MMVLECIIVVMAILSNQGPTRVLWLLSIFYSVFVQIHALGATSHKGHVKRMTKDLHHV